MKTWKRIRNAISSYIEFINSMYMEVPEMNEYAPVMMYPW